MQNVAVKMESSSSAAPPFCEETKENVDPPLARPPISDGSQTPDPHQEYREEPVLEEMPQSEEQRVGEQRHEVEVRRPGTVPPLFQHYLDEAERDKERYTEELQLYHKTQAYRSYSHKGRHRGGRQGEGEHRGLPLIQPQGEKDTVLKERSVFDIPIFTEEFLNHSKAREAELRQLRKFNMEYEERNAALQKHVESMRSAVKRLEAELDQEQGRNALLQQHLQTVRQALTHCFRAVNVPGTTETPSPETIDSYMSHLQSTVLTHPQESEALVTGVREVLSQLEG
ncbi:high mobility group protein 20A-like [Ascaphus truei]|uniref:high mobility group protein 20A-like n=1 Tax=Ascaphus truei TaxID=8439 RepID=UPI003F59084E